MKNKTAPLALLFLFLTGVQAQVIGDPTISVDFAPGDDKISGTYSLDEQGQTYTYTHQLADFSSGTTCGVPAATLPGLAPDAITTPGGTSMVAPVTVTFGALTTPAYTAPVNPGETSEIKFCQVITATSGSGVTTNVQTSIFTVTVTQEGSFTTGTGAVTTATNTVDVTSDTGSVAVVLSALFLDSDGLEQAPATQALVPGQPLFLRIRTADGSDAGISVLSIDSMTATVTGATAFSDPTAIVTGGTVEGTYWNTIVSVSCSPITGCDLTFLLPVADFFAEAKAITLAGTAILQVGSNSRRLGEGEVKEAAFTATVTTTEANDSASSHGGHHAGTGVVLAAISSVVALTFA